MGHVTWPCPFQGQFVSCRLGLAMFKPHTKFKMSTITCNKEMKGNAKCKNSHFEPPWGLRSNARGSSMARWKAHCRLSISNNSTFRTSSHGCGTIKRNLSKSAFSEGWVILSAIFLVDGDVARNSSTDRYIEEWCSFKYPLEVFTQRNFVADFFGRSLILL